MLADPRIGNDRAHRDIVLTQAQHLTAAQHVSDILDAVPEQLLILNSQRQIVFANKATLRLLQLPAADRILGRRPGEILDCEHALNGNGPVPLLSVLGCDGACGTTLHCSTCGAAKAIAACERGASDVQECRIIQHRTRSALDLRVTTTPISVNGQVFTLMSLCDITHEKRRQAMERIFFHDLLNIAGAISGYADLIERMPQEARDIAPAVRKLVQNLAEEIRAQRELSDAETGDLTPKSEPVDGTELVNQVAQMYATHECALGKHIAVQAPSGPVIFNTDRRLLLRVLGNMLKNALEASALSQTVTLRCTSSLLAAEFAVHNPAHMPHDVQLQVFQRSFSTKGRGRGLGTYSMRLLTERYLGGSIGFTSTADQGTTFTVRLPRTLPA